MPFTIHFKCQHHVRLVRWQWGSQLSLSLSHDSHGRLTSSALGSNSAVSFSYAEDQPPSAFPFRIDAGDIFVLLGHDRAGGLAALTTPSGHTSAIAVRPLLGAVLAEYRVRDESNGISIDR